MVFEFFLIVSSSYILSWIWLKLCHFERVKGKMDLAEGIQGRYDCWDSMTLQICKMVW